MTTADSLVRSSRNLCKAEQYHWAFHDPAGHDLFGGHGVGADDDPGQKYPAGHSTDDVGVAQKRPLGHGSHDFLPAQDTYVPGSHAVGTHMPGTSHLDPIGQMVWVVLFCFRQ